MQRSILAALLFGLAAASCAAVTTAQYRGASAGPIGCPEEEIEVSDHRNVVWAGQSATWRATCRGRTFICSLAGAVATCKEEMSADGSAPASGGCAYDTQCKGDRICVERVCVDPTATSTSSVRAAPLHAPGGARTLSGQ